MEFFKILWRLLKPFKRQFLVYLGIIVVYESFQIVDSYVLGFIVDLIGRGVSQRLLIALLVGIIIFDEVFMRLDRRLDWQIIVKLFYPIYNFLKKGPLRIFLAMEMGWHREQRSGALVGKVNHGTNKILDMVCGICWEFAPTAIQLVLSLVPLLWVSPQVAVIVAVSLTIFLVLTMKQHAAQAPLRKRRHDGYEDEWAKAHEAVANVETVVLYNQQERLTADYDDVLRTIESCDIEEARIGIYQYGSWRIRTIDIARRLVLGLLVWQVLQGGLTIGLLVFAWTLSEKLFHSFWRFARLFDRAAQAEEAGKRVERTFGLTPSIVDPEYSQTIHGGPIAFTFENVSFSYDGNGESIRNLDLVIRGGETVGVVGPSGAGKTTLRRLLTRAWEVTEGRILVNGIDVRDLSLSDLRGFIAYVPQGDEVVIFNETFAYNIAFGRPSASSEEVMEAARVAGIHDYIVKCKVGYDTLLGERGLRLSGGQKQRLALARAILADRPVLILDEATSSVDSITEGEIQERLIPILKDRQRTVVIIAHRLSTIWGVADRILVFDEGKLMEEGIHEALLEQNGLYAELFERQFRQVREVLSR